MTVREAISIVIRTLPGSDKLPRTIEGILDKKKPDSQTCVDEYEEDVKMTMASSMTPAQLLRLRMASSRGHSGRDVAPNQSKEVDVHRENLAPYPEPTSLDSIEEMTLQDSESEYTRAPIVDQYLTEQNEKFNSLIHRNLWEVMNQQQRFEEGAGWKRLALDLFLSKSLPEATERASVIMDKISLTASSYIPALAQKHSPQAFIDEYEAHVAQIQAKRLLETYTDEEKTYIYKELSQEFKPQESPRYNSQEHILPPDATYLDKAEALVILSIRLSFAGLRHSLPIMQQAANKFKNDEIVLFNSSNFNRLLSSIINLLERIEKKVGSSTSDSNEPRLTEVAAKEEPVCGHTRNNSDTSEWSKSMLKLVAGPDYRISRQMYFEYSPQTNISGQDESLNEVSNGKLGTFIDAAQRFASEMT